MSGDERSMLNRIIGRVDDRCDHCGQGVHRDGNGWWVAVDESSDCPAEPSGHAVDGHQR